MGTTVFHPPDAPTLWHKQMAASGFVEPLRHSDNLQWDRCGVSICTMQRHPLSLGLLVPLDLLECGRTNCKSLLHLQPRSLI